MQQPEDISYRKATLSDVKKLSILYKQVYIQTYGTEGVSDEFANFITTQFAVERLESIIHEQPDSILVAAYKNNLVGVAEIEYDKQTPVGGLVGPELNKLYILEWFCGKGIGRNLLRLAEDMVSSQGNKFMWLWVLATNDRAVSFYERQQYQWVGNASFQMEENSYDNKVMLKLLN
jgi:ribosomal protein S18 acetylase RimI-like enzyme